MNHIVWLVQCIVTFIAVTNLIWSIGFVLLFQVLKETFQQETLEGLQSTASVRVTSNITAYCIASNSYGNDSQSFSIKGSESPSPSLPCVFLYL